MKTLILKYAFEYLTGEPVYIDNAPNGLSCNCICPECGKQMIAIQGKSENHREWHFRHSEETNCKGGQETAIHKLAKQIIVDNSQIEIPGDTLNYSETRQEEKFQSVIPDVTVIANGRNVFFEIEVTNPVDNFKEAFYKNGKYKSVKIDLTNISQDTTPEKLKEIVLQQTNNKKLIFWDTTWSKLTLFCKENPKTALIIGIGVYLIIRRVWKIITK
jgi:hypothetical protein